MRIVFDWESWKEGSYVPKNTVANSLEPLETVTNSPLRKEGVLFIRALWLFMLPVVAKESAIANDLASAMTEGQANDVFEAHGVFGDLERINLLRMCMGISNMFQPSDHTYLDGVSGDMLESFLCDKYSDELAIFLDGEWRSWL